METVTAPPSVAVRRTATDLRSALVGPALTAMAAAGSVALLAVVDPNVPGVYPRCPSLTLFGVYCPLCGGLRGMHALSRLDVVGMISSNALLPVIVLAGAWGWLSWTLRASGISRRLPPPRLSGRVWLVFAVVALTYGVVRNFAPFAVLAP